MVLLGREAQRIQENRGGHKVQRVDFDKVKIGGFYYASLGRMNIITTAHQPKVPVAERVRVLAKAGGRITVESISDMRPVITLDVVYVTQASL
jgi:hypothetical protein